MSLPLSKNISYFAQVDFRDDKRLFGIHQADRLTGMYLLGKTNSGKSTTLKTLFYQDMLHNRGATLYDCHGDLLEQVLALVPEHRKKDVIVFDATNPDIKLGYNPLKVNISYHKRSLIASSILETFQKLWGQQGWGVKLEYILRQVLLSLLDQPNANFSDIPRILLDEDYRHACLPNIVNENTRRFWLKEFPKLSGKSDILPVLNKVSGFLSIPIIHKILVENEKQLSLRWIIDNNKILLINLSKGSIGSDGVHLLGSLLLNAFFSAGYSRIDTAEDKRTPYFLYLDEFQNYTSGSIANALSELRKFKVGFVLAHQYLHQLSSDIRNAVLGNIGTIICFKLGQADAKYMEKEFYPIFSASDFLNLSHHHIYLKLLIAGSVSQGFSAKTILPSALATKKVS